MTQLETCLVCQAQFVATSSPEHCCSERCWQTAVEYIRIHRGFRADHFKKPKPYAGWKPGRPRRSQRVSETQPVV